MPCFTSPPGEPPTPQPRALDRASLLLQAARFGNFLEVGNYLKDGMAVDTPGNNGQTGELAAGCVGAAGDVLPERVVPGGGGGNLCCCPPNPSPVCVCVCLWLRC
jgi:hypothetical protein